jgi:hypothetical protein
LRGNVNSRGFEENDRGIEGKEVPLPVVATIIRRRSGKSQGGKIFRGAGSKPWYNFRRERSDKAFSFQSQTRRGKLNRKSPKI